MDLVGSELGKPAGELSEYSLNGSLDAAVRASSAQYDSPDILDRLRLRLHRQLASDTGPPPPPHPSGPYPFLSPLFICTPQPLMTDGTGATVINGRPDFAYRHIHNISIFTAS